jgi:hypothetical protein
MRLHKHHSGPSAVALLLATGAACAQAPYRGIAPAGNGPVITGPAMPAQYQECAAARGREVRLATLSNELVNNRQTLAMVEKMHEEKRRNPGTDPGLRGEWRMLARIDPVQARGELGQQFVEYRAAGGPAARVEDVERIANPCLPAKRAVTGPSPVRREAILVPAGK